MGSCMSKSNTNNLVNIDDSNINPNHVNQYDSAYESGMDEEIKHVDTDLEPEFFKQSSRLIPYSDDDPIDEKIRKIKLRWRMNRKNVIDYMRMLKMDKILQMSIANHLPPFDDLVYESSEDLLDVLYQNEIPKSIFCQYWKVEANISSRQIIKRHIDLVFKFKEWKVQEQLSYVNESDLELFEPYNAVFNTKTLIVKYTKYIFILTSLHNKYSLYQYTHKTIKLERKYESRRYFSCIKTSMA